MLPQVVPALDPKTPIYSTGFTYQLIQRKMKEYGLWEPERYHTFRMRERFTAGPFELEPIRVTHSIPDACGVIFRCEDGTIVHTGDWKVGNTCDEAMSSPFGEIIWFRVFPVGM